MSEEVVAPKFKWSITVGKVAWGFLQGLVALVGLVPLSLLLLGVARVSVPIARRRGFIVNISHWAAQKYIGNVAYGVAKAATDKMTADMAVELK